jgi:hypothetical protein
MVRRDLGTGRWDKILIRKMTALSVADNYNEAKEEWLATGQVWWVGNGEKPDWVEESQMGFGKCLCGHNIVYHFEIVNTENGIVECVGSDHINSYLIMKQIAQETQIDIELVTDEQVERWITQRVGSMKAEAWWAENGASFEMMFNKVKEIDVRFNTRRDSKNNFYDPKVKRYVLARKLRKKAEGWYAEDSYKMASIVWRWNHPDNSRAQINTRGYPNDRLMKDLALYFVKSDPLIARMNREKAEREERMAEVVEERRLEGIRLAEVQAGRDARREMVWVQGNFMSPEAMVNAKENRLRQTQRNELEQKRRAEHLRLQAIDEKEMLESKTETFENMCEYYGIPVFDESFAGNTWEREFLVSIKKQLNFQKELTERQLRTCKEIFDDGEPTEKQVKYLKDLGYEGEIPSKRFASRKIEEIKGEE